MPRGQKFCILRFAQTSCVCLCHSLSVWRCLLATAACSLSQANRSSVRLSRLQLINAALSPGHCFLWGGLRKAELCLPEPTTLHLLHLAESFLHFSNSFHSMS